MCVEKLTWDEIKKRYDKEWVELVDYEWPEEKPYPVAGTVRAHASNRKAFYQWVNTEPMPKDSAIVYVGKIQMSDGVIRHNLYQITTCE